MAARGSAFSPVGGQPGQHEAVWRLRIEETKIAVQELRPKDDITFE
jgi:hypothetical protein